MLFITVEDFFAEADKTSPLTREKERSLAVEKAGNESAREELIQGYLPMVAGFIRRAPQKLHTLKTVYACLDTLEKGVDSFNFLQDSESFSHHLSWRLRQCLTKGLAE